MPHPDEFTFKNCAADDFLEFARMLRKDFGKDFAWLRERVRRDLRDPFDENFENLPPQPNTSCDGELERINQLAEQVVNEAYKISRELRRPSTKKAKPKKLS